MRLDINHDQGSCVPAIFDFYSEIPFEVRQWRSWVGSTHPRYLLTYSFLIHAARLRVRKPSESHHGRVFLLT